MTPAGGSGHGTSNPIAASSILHGSVCRHEISVAEGFFDAAGHVVYCAACLREGREKGGKREWLDREYDFDLRPPN